MGKSRALWKRVAAHHSDLSAILETWKLPSRFFGSRAFSSPIACLLSPHAFRVIPNYCLLPSC